MELHHIVPHEAHGTDEIGNAIPVCFECHAEIALYNDKHPRGRKYRSDELRLHKDQWLKICDSQPEALVEGPRMADVGPVQALVDELEFNEAVSAQSIQTGMGCPFETDRKSVV